MGQKESDMTEQLNNESLGILWPIKVDTKIGHHNIYELCAYFQFFALFFSPCPTHILHSLVLNKHFLWFYFLLFFFLTKKLLIALECSIFIYN